MLNENEFQKEIEDFCQILKKCGDEVKVPDFTRYAYLIAEKLPAVSSETQHIALRLLLKRIEDTELAEKRKQDYDNLPKVQQKTEMLS